MIEKHLHHFGFFFINVLRPCFCSMNMNLECDYNLKKKENRNKKGESPYHHHFYEVRNQRLADFSFPAPTHYAEICASSARRAMPISTNKKKTLSHNRPWILVVVALIFD